jgi:hypothetical protein
VLAGVRLVHPLVSRSLQQLKGSPTD